MSVYLLFDLVTLQRVSLANTPCHTSRWSCHMSQMSCGRCQMYTTPDTVSFTGQLFSSQIKQLRFYKEGYGCIKEDFRLLEDGGAEISYR